MREGGERETGPYQREYEPSPSRADASVEGVLVPPTLTKAYSKRDHATVLVYGYGYQLSEPSFLISYTTGDSQQQRV